MPRLHLSSLPAVERGGARSAAIRGPRRARTAASPAGCFSAEAVPTVREVLAEIPPGERLGIRLRGPENASLLGPARRLAAGFGHAGIDGSDPGSYDRAPRSQRRRADPDQAPDDRRCPGPSRQRHAASGGGLAEGLL